MICLCKIWDWKSFPSDILSTVSIMEGMNKRKYFYCAVKYSVKNCAHGELYINVWWYNINSLLDNVNNIINTKSRTFIQLNRMYWYSIKSYASYIWYIGLDCSISILRSIYLFLKADLQCLYPTSLFPYVLSYLIINVYLQNAITYILQGIDFLSK